MLLIGLGAYLFLQNQKKPSIENPTQVESQQEQASKNSIRNLLTSGVSQMCSYSSDNVEGKVYVTKERVRGDFSLNAEEKRVSHVIIDGNTMYSWMDGENKGFKMTFDREDFNKEATGSAEGNVDLDAQFDYKCATWTVDNTMFDLPKGVTFASFTAPSVPAANCSVCNNLSGESKSQCLRALKC